MSDGNKRILGDVWINEENLNRQREFFRDIIESYQAKYGGEFDASTLQGFHASDFATAEQGLLAEHAIQEPLWLGKKRIANVENQQYIFTDAVLIDRDISNTESSAYEITNIDWFNVEGIQELNVTDALVRIYRRVKAIESDIVNNVVATKLDSSVYEDFLLNDFNPIQQQISDNTINFHDTVTGQNKKGLNANLVNGVRPILITEAAYNDLLESEDENDQNLINDWRNFFIFVESLPADYNQPWEYALTDPYDFQISDGYLQVKNGYSTEWKNMASIEEFLNEGNFDNIIKTYIETSEDFKIGSTSLLNSLKLLSVTTINENWRDYPFLSSSLHDDYIYHLTINNANNYVTETPDSNSFKNVNIDLAQLLKDKEVLNADGTTRINAIQSVIDTHASTLTTIRNQIDNDIIPTDNTQTLDIQGIKNRLDGIENSLRSISGNIDAIKKWESTFLRTVPCEYPDPRTGECYATPSTTVWYNTALRLCCVYCNGWIYSHKKANAGKWEKTDLYVPYSMHPKIQYHVTTSNPNIKVKINTDNFVYIKHEGTYDKVDNLWFEAFYNY